MARSLWLGPGAALSGLARVLRGARQLHDLADLLFPGPRPHNGAAQQEPAMSASRFEGVLLLDLAETPLEDAGLLERARRLHPTLELAWTGRPSDLGRFAALSRPEDRLLPWPVDVLALDVDDAPASEPSEQAPPRVEESAPIPAEAQLAAPPPAGALDPELAEIEAILAAWPGTEQALGSRTFSTSAPASAPSAPQHLPEELAPSEERALKDPLLSDPFGGSDLLGAEDQLDEWESAAPEELDDELDDLLPDLELDDPGPGSLEPLDDPFSAEPPVSSTAPGTAPEDPFAVAPRIEGPAPLPTWYRAQVADLADLVQRAELALLRAEDDGDVAAAGAELGRLRQFARTLGFLAAPPEAGRSRIDLGVLVEEVLASLAARPEDANGRPRFLFRAPAAVEIQGDKGLLVAALDAVLQTAAAATREGDTVRTEVLESDAGVAEVRVDLPRGSLSGLPAERLLEPYALQGRLEGIGPNALAAAGGILVGHHGDLRVRDLPAGRLLLSLRLPLAR